MTARLAERVRAFGVLAPYLPAEKAGEIAAALAVELEPPKAARGSQPHVDARVVVEPPKDPAGFVSVTTFLLRKGFEGVGLVRAVPIVANRVSRFVGVKDLDRPQVDLLPLRLAHLFDHAFEIDRAELEALR